MITLCITPSSAAGKKGGEAEAFTSPTAAVCKGFSVLLGNVIAAYHKHSSSIGGPSSPTPLIGSISKIYPPNKELNSASTS